MKLSCWWRSCFLLVLLVPQEYSNARVLVVQMSWNEPMFPSELNSKASERVTEASIKTLIDHSRITYSQDHNILFSSYKAPECAQTMDDINRSDSTTINGSCYRRSESTPSAYRVLTDLPETEEWYKTGQGLLATKLSVVFQNSILI